MKLEKIFILTLSDNIICTSIDKKYIQTMQQKIKKDLDNIENTFRNEKDMLINSGKYPIHDEDDKDSSPFYSRILCKMFDKTIKRIWKNKEYKYLIDLGLRDVNYCQKASWCKFEIIKSNNVSI